MLRIAKAFIVLLLILFVSGSRADVTLITHGLQFASDYPEWVDTMADAVVERAGSNTTLIRMDVELSSPFFGELRVSRFSIEQGKIPGAQDWTGETVIKLFWHTVAGVTDPYNTRDIALEVAPFLIAPIRLSDLVIPPLARSPFHFIGHSRGGSLVCELALALAEHDIWVDHVTTLDPHPAITDPIFATDFPLVIPDNVTFLDNYFQTSNYPDGQPILGSAQVNLTLRGIFGHSEVHEWYLGTIAGELPRVIPPYWYTTNDIGFGFSAVAGGRKFRRVLSSSYDGNGLRWKGAERFNAVSDPASTWPNVDVESAIEPFFLNGQSAAIKGRVGGSGQTFVGFGIDDDKNPHNNTGASVLASTFLNMPFGEFLTNLWQVRPQLEHEGNYFYGFVTVENRADLTRFYYLDHAVSVQELRFQQQTLHETNMLLGVNANGITPIRIESSLDFKSWRHAGVTSNAFFSIQLLPGETVPALFLRAAVE